LDPELNPRGKNNGLTWATGWSAKPSGMAAFDELLARLRSRPETVLVASDYDGTIAPIVEDPACAVPDPRAVRALSALVGRVGAVVVVSGRPAGFLEAMLSLPGMLYCGLYGMETNLPNGGGIGNQNPPPEPQGLEDFPFDPAYWRNCIASVVRSAQNDLAARYPEDFSLEDKGLSLVVHYRKSKQRQRARSVARAWAESVAQRTGLRIVEGKLNVELLPDVPLGKGRALSRVLSVLGPKIGSLVFLGDDIGDLEAFEAARRWAEGLNGRLSLCVAVASPEAPSELLEEADLVLEDQGKVWEFLGSLAAQLEAH
jgi:trehalose 6-phosphate phosphatase